MIWRHRKKKKIANSICYFISGYDYANREWVDIFDTADAYSGDLELAVGPVVNSNGFLREEYLNNGVLYIHRFYINPEYRSQGIGTIVLPLIIDVLGREAGVITVTPVPYEKDGCEKIEEENPNYIKEKEKSVNLFEKFGFIQDEIYKKVWVKDTTLKE